MESETFAPDKRKWISTLVNLRNESALLQDAKNRFEKICSEPLKEFDLEKFKVSNTSCPCRKKFEDAALLAQFLKSDLQPSTLSENRFKNAKSSASAKSRNESYERETLTCANEVKRPLRRSQKTSPKEVSSDAKPSTRAKSSLTSPKDNDNDVQTIVEKDLLDDILKCTATAFHPIKVHLNEEDRKKHESDTEKKLESMNSECARIMRKDNLSAFLNAFKSQVKDEPQLVRSEMDKVDGYCLNIFSHLGHKTPMASNLSDDYNPLAVSSILHSTVAHEEFSRLIQKEETCSKSMPSSTIDTKEDFVIEGVLYHSLPPGFSAPDEIMLPVKHKEKGIFDDLDFILSEGTPSSPDGAFVSENYERKRHGLLTELISFKILGSNTVEDLRHFLKCEKDLQVVKDVKHPEETEEDDYRPIFAKDIYPHAAIYIEDKVFVDKGNNPDFDYVAQVNDWCGRYDRKIGPFEEWDIKTPLKDIPMRCGNSYMFTHIGDCEHILVFTKVRLLNEKEPRETSAYPCLRGDINASNILCEIDSYSTARWVVVNNIDLPFNPMYLCTECVLTFCYIGYTKAEEFQLYPFHQLVSAW